MRFKEILLKAAQEVPGLTKLGVHGVDFAYEKDGIEVFDYLKRGGSPAKLGEAADYLDLYTQIGQLVIKQAGSNCPPFIMASDADGTQLFVLEHEKKDGDIHNDPYLYLLRAVRSWEAAANDQYFFGFFAAVEINNPATEVGFDRRGRKLLNRLSGIVQENWGKVVETQCPFLKTELYVFSLQKLHSWGFQILSDEMESEIQLVRGQAAQPRGTDRKRRRK